MFMAIKSKRPLPKKDIKQPSIPIPSVGYVGQDLGSLLSDNRNKVDMNWLEQVGSNQPGSSTGSAGGGSSFNPLSKLGINFDSDWSQVLKAVGADSPFGQFLSNLGVGGKDPFDQVIHDFNGKILEQILQYYVTQEQRGYDRALQQDQRLYDSPLNQLARLMGAGISRDAAIQMLSGSGSGSGAAVPYGQTGNDVQLESASQAYANQMAGGTAIANSVFGGISALTGLASLGLSIPQAVQQIGIMQNNRYMSNMQRQAFDAASAAHTILLGSGLELTADTFGSVKNTLSAISSLAESGNESARAFIQNGGAQQLAETSPYSSPMLQQMYSTERAAQDYAAEFDQHINMLQAQNDLMRINKDNLFKEGRNIEATYNKIVSETNYNIKQAKVCEKTAKYYEELAKSEPARRKQLLAEAKRLRESARNLRAQTSNINEQTRGIQMQNDILQTALGLSDVDGKTGMWYASHKVWNQLYGDCSKLAYSNNRKLWLHEVNAMLADADKREAVSTLEEMYTNGSLSLLASQDQEMQNLIYLCNVLDQTGVFDYIRTEADAGEHSFRIGLSGVSWTEKGGLPFYTPTSIKPNKRLQHGGRVSGAGAKW